MKINNNLLNPDVGLPSWLLALQQTLDGDRLSTRRRVLGPITALNELESLTSAGPPRAADVASLTSDLRLALQELGPDLASVTRVGVMEFQRHTLSQLRQMLASKEGLGLAATAARTLRERLRADDSAAAAWRDYVQAFRENDRYEVCLRRWSILYEIVTHRGHVWESESELIARVINDSAEHAARAGAPIERPSGRRWDIEDRAGLDACQRLALVERHVRSARDIEPVTVWLMIYDARLSAPVEAGSVLLLDAAQLRTEAVDQEPGPEAFGLPAGMERFIAAQLLGDLDEGAHAVVARVRTATRAGEAVEFARAAVSAVLDSTLLDERTRGWELADGHLLSGEKAWSHRRFSRRGSGRFDMNRMIERFVHRPEDAVTKADGRIIDAWAARRPDALAAVELARWDRSLSRSVDDVFRVALGIRGLERTLPVSRVNPGSNAAHWTEAVAYYLKDRWVWQTFKKELDDIRVHVISPPQERLGWTPGSGEMNWDSVSQIDQFYRQLKDIVDSDDPSLAQIVQFAPQLQRLMPEGSSRHRILCALVEDTTTPDSLTSWLGHLNAEFDARLARAARQRNASVHGTVTVPAVIGDALDLVEDLSRMVTRDALTAVAEGEPLLDRLERLRLEERERRAALKDGGTLADILDTEGATAH
jgi:hypothetical protein